MTTPLLTVSKASISFGGIQALRNVDFEIGKGEIRCLVGENGSGKSTFVKLISGVYRPDSGEIAIDGEVVTQLTPRSANAAGIQVIYQDLSLFGHLSVAENIAINRMLHDGSKFVHRKEMRKIAREQLLRVGVDLPLDAPASTLSVANRQIVAICRALSLDARLLFMDEPTTALTRREVARLLSIVLELKRRGLSIIFISHKLNEVFKVADSITIFRDGSKVGDFRASDLDELSLSRHMTGHDVSYVRYQRKHTDNTPLLEVRGLSRKGNYEDIDLTVRPGDIVGVAGLLGSGRTELALSLFGLNEPDKGTVLVKGKEATIRSPWEAMDHGLALLPEERLTQGLFGPRSIEENSSVTMLDEVSRGRVLSPRAERSLGAKVIEEMRVNTKDPRMPVVNLSGGNQQKVVIGKWIFRNPAVFMLDSPTVGIDIGSKAEIYDQIHRLADSGMGVILISDENEEIVANCNRIIVMHEGHVLANFNEVDLADPEFKDRLDTIISDPYRFAEEGSSKETVTGQGPTPAVREQS